MRPAVVRRETRDTVLLMKGNLVRSGVCTLAVLSGMLLMACAPGQRPFRQVQVCLNSPQEIPAFKSEMRALARANGMEFGDRSSQAEAEAERIQAVRPDAEVARPTIVISGRRQDGVSFGATNFAAAPTQIVIGFQLGRDEAGREFSNTVSATLARRWRVREGPDPNISGAFPLEDCGPTENP